MAERKVGTVANDRGVFEVYSLCGSVPGGPDEPGSDEWVLSTVGRVTRGDGGGVALGSDFRVVVVTTFPASEAPARVGRSAMVLPMTDAEKQALEAELQRVKMGPMVSYDSSLRLETTRESLRQESGPRCAHRTADGRPSGRCVACGSEFVSSGPQEGGAKEFGPAPRDMDYSQGWEQMVRFTLDLFGVPLASGRGAPEGGAKESGPEPRDFDPPTVVEG